MGDRHVDRGFGYRAQDFVGVSGQAYRFGVSVGNFDWIGSVPAMLLAAFIFIPYFWKAGVYTIPEYLGMRYNDGVRVITSLTWIVFFAFDLGVIFWASAMLLHTLMGWPPMLSILITASVVGAYSLLGGLTAVIMTDVVQLIIMFVGGLITVVLGFLHVGGWSGLVEKISAMGPQYDGYFELIQPMDTQTPFPWTGILFGLTFVMANAYMIGNQAVVQRCLAAKSVWHAKASMILGAFLKMFIPVMVLFPGLIALVVHPGLEDGDMAFPKLIVTLLPPGLGGLMFAALLAGLMSSIDSMVNSTATLWTKDIYEKYIYRNASDKHYLLVGKITTFLLLLFGVLTSPVSADFPGIYVAIQTYLSFFQGPIFAILLLGIFFRRITAAGALVGLIGGMSVAAALHYHADSLFAIEDPFLYVSWWSFVAGLVITVLLSSCTTPHSDKRLSGLVIDFKRQPLPLSEEV